ncbi:helix-turn-helix domain-containing protein [Actinokineospora globicatena]|uniref:helix-turn-helix domain-containing protein n=1 Tax=Actinokineospora globicatena TaxID=103729 RepID=UPI0020A41BCB|nr:helix-turn-helix transcriptional regulator [Actinokineospora globicatena]MCP2306680.1 Helix-turn-helix domain-containing protein [Actinokineospora globicatena]GLW82205.1 transcriptional regulator [Actinokineospora globicatena]GLW88998.1 transcriptional regulator [Actinokineospora globicatena]
MSVTRGAEPQQRKLRLELRHARTAAGFSQKQVADALEWSLSKVVRIEQGAVGVSITDLRALLHHYGVSDREIVDELLDLARKRTESRWWEKYAKDIPTVLVQLIEMEDVATRIRQFQGHIVPGMLQNEELTRAIIAGYPGEPARVEQMVSLRLRRQHILADESREFTYILDESVLRRRIGSTEILAAQNRRLVELTERPNISISVIPFSHGSHQAMQGSYTVLDVPVGYDDDDVDSIVLLQGPLRDSIIRRDPNRISEFIEAFAQLEHMAIPLENWEGLADLV